MLVNSQHYQRLQSTLPILTKIKTHLVESIFVYTNNDVFTSVDPGLLLRGCLFNSQFRHARRYCLGHTTKFIDFGNDLSENHILTANNLCSEQSETEKKLTSA